MAARRGKSQAKRNTGGGRRGVPGWIWLLAGLLIGLGLAVGLLIHDGFDARRLLPQPNPGATAPKEPEPPVAQKPSAAPAKKPKYDFYTVLPEREVQIPDAELAEKAKAEPAPAATPTAPAERLLLQAGSFSDPRRAEEVKASIAFTGLIARVEPTRTANGATVHRVMLGPYGSLRELDAAKQQLKSNGIDAIAIREPGKG